MDTMEEKEKGSNEKKYLLEEPSVRSFFVEVEQQIEPIRKALPYGPLRQWIKESFDPITMIKSEKNTSVMHALLSYAHYTAIVNIITAAVFTTMTCGLGILSLIFTLILLPLSIPLLTLIFLFTSGVTYVLALAVGGKGSYGLFLNKLVTATKMHTMVTTLAMLPAMIPIVGIAWVLMMGIFNMLFSVYKLYLEYVVVRETFSLSMHRSIIVVVGTAILLMVLFLSMYFLLIFLNLIAQFLMFFAALSRSM